MLSLGKYRQADGAMYNALINHKKNYLEVILYDDNGNIVSAYKKDNNFEGAAVSKIANNLAKFISKGLASCTAENGVPVAFVLGSCSKHTFKKSNINYEIGKYNNEMCNAYITSEMFMLEVDYCEQSYKIPHIEYVEYTHKKAESNFKESDDDNEDIPVRTLDEISLEKDVTWLKNKKYYIVNDEATAEQIFSYLDNYNGVISFDTETTGLRINMFCQIGSEKKKELEAYNEQAIKDGKPTMRTDRLVGFIYCIQPNVSYYFPCFNRKFKNLYNDVNEPVTRKTINNILASYTVGEYRDRHDYMAEFIRNTPPEQWGSDVILMERNRKILETKNLLAHNGTYEWKVCWNYWIDFHLTEDSMIMHQLMYKFRSTTRNSGEPSNLKYLTKTEFGVDQLELSDFFSGFSEDDSGKASGGGKKKKGLRIDFSYMDYDGSRAYAPADGDFTLGLYLKYKPDLIKNHKELEYLYSVEILVSQAIGYMEYYGHRIDPVKINNIYKQYVADKLSLEYKIRELINYNTDDEKEVYKHITDIANDIDELDKKISELKKEMPGEPIIEELKNERDNQYKAKENFQNKLTELYENSQNQLNLASPAQVAELFYEKLGIPCSEEKPSVNKKVIKGLLKAKNEDGSMKYPVVDLYSKWKNTDTYITKFFGNLPDFMYPGGYIFSSFGQISTATGRMSCKSPNAQQYPKAVTAIVNPRPGFVMVDADFSQIEYRTLVALANEQELLNKFKDPDMDYHTTMASLMYGVPYASVTPKQRGDAKSFNFGIPYGMGFGSLAILLTGINNEATRAEAMEKYELYFKDQPHVRQYFKDVKEFANVKGYTETKWGRRRYYSFVDKDGNFSNAKKAQALRQAGNAVIQGCLDGDTKIETKEFGVKPIKELEGYSGLVWNGTDWTHGDILYSGKKQKCIITFADDTEFICSPIHKFLLTGKDPSDINNYVECKDLTDKHYIECNISTKSSLTKFSKAANKIAKLNRMTIGLKVKSVEITDEYIDMYDVCNTDCGYYVADGIITHNTAADIFKIGVARNFAFIRKNKLFGKMLIVNMIHDEQLIEADARCLDIKAVVAALVQNMEMKIDGFPPLYVGAGVGLSWKDAKGKMNEINPKLADQLVNEAKNISIFTDKPKTQQEVLDYFNKRVYEFRRDKIIDYVKDTNNYHKTLHPVIGNLLSLQFDYGVNAEFDVKYTEDNGYTKDEIANAKKLIPIEQLKRFLADMGITDIDAELFMSEEDLKNEQAVYTEEPEEDEEYSDGEDDEDVDDLDSIELSGEKFELFDESDKESLYGVGVGDLIGEFGLFVSKKMKICGIDANKVRARYKDTMADYLSDHISESENADTDSESLEIVFLLSNNIVKHTGGYVKNIKQKELADACGIKANVF